MLNVCVSLKLESIERTYWREKHMAICHDCNAQLLPEGNPRMFWARVDQEAYKALLVHPMILDVVVSSDQITRS